MLGKSHPAASLWEPEIEKILILKSKCHRLGGGGSRDSENKHEYEERRGVEVGTRVRSKEEMGEQGSAMEPACLLECALRRKRPCVSVQMVG